MEIDAPIPERFVVVVECRDHLWRREILVEITPPCCVTSVYRSAFWVQQLANARSGAITSDEGVNGNLFSIGERHRHRAAGSFRKINEALVELDCPVG